MFSRILSDLISVEMSRRLHLASVVLLSVLSSVFGSEDHSGINKNVFVSSEIKADDLNCDRQLHLLREALSAQEEWALRCKFQAKG